MFTKSPTGDHSGNKRNEQEKKKQRNKIAGMKMNGCCITYLIKITLFFIFLQKKNGREWEEKIILYG